MITLIPAYGADYRSKSAVLAAWARGADFILNDFGTRYDGKPVNNAGLMGQTVVFRYGKLRKAFTHTI